MLSNGYSYLSLTLMEISTMESNQRLFRQNITQQSSLIHDAILKNSKGRTDREQLVDVSNWFTLRSESLKLNFVSLPSQIQKLAELFVRFIHKSCSKLSDRIAHSISKSLLGASLHVCR